MAKRSIHEFFADGDFPERGGYIPSWPLRLGIGHHTLVPFFGL
ncbi:hypothetical protein C7S15_5172 [Burkholderia cepacia]|nr:hypothetical protein [Burkholderia cepacia]